MIKYKKIPNNENAIEIDGKVILSFDPKYKEYLKKRACKHSPKPSF